MNNKNDRTVNIIKHWRTPISKTESSVHNVPLATSASDKRAPWRVHPNSVIKDGLRSLPTCPHMGTPTLELPLDWDCPLLALPGAFGSLVPVSLVLPSRLRAFEAKT
jgi:hypothetical protein